MTARRERGFKITAGSGELHLKGHQYLVSFVLPNLFPRPTLYNILRPCAVPICKRDYLGNPAMTRNVNVEDEPRQSAVNAPPGMERFPLVGASHTPALEGDVLILAPQDDVHAAAVAKTLERDFNIAAHIWNLSSFPEAPSRYEYAENDFRFFIRSAEIGRFRSVWWRRVDNFEPSPTIVDAITRDFCVRESDAYMYGAFVSCGVHLVNDPFQQRLAGYKPYQLSMATKLGLSIPHTLMTNDPGAARTFWDRHSGNCIYKTFRPSQARVLETRAFKDEDLVEIDKIRFAPIIIQQMVAKQLDVRVNIFGEQIYAAEVIVNRDVAELDWRLDPTAVWKTHSLPEQIQQKLKILIQHLRLEYGCIDMRLTPRGEYVFFEVNPAGQFLFIEIDTDQSLCKSLASLLAQKA